MKKHKIIFGVITVLGIVSPVLYLTRLIEASVAFPTMFTIIGIQQVYYGLFLVPEETVKIKRKSIIFGSIFIFFGLAIVLPFYIFFE